MSLLEALNSLGFIIVNDCDAKHWALCGLVLWLDTHGVNQACLVTALDFSCTASV